MNRDGGDDRQPFESGRRVEKILSGLFLVGLYLVLALVGAEWASRYILGEYRSEFEKSFPISQIKQVQPYTMFGNRPLASYGKEKINSLGFRGSAPTIVKPEGEVRVFVLGGSTVFLGSGTAPNLSIAKHLERIFARSGKDNVRVFNFGVPSSTSGQELARIVYQIADLEPDLVIMYNGANDFLIPTAYDPRPGYPWDFIVLEANPLLHRSLNDYPGMTLALFGTNLGRHFWQNYFLDKLLDLPRMRREVGYGTLEWERRIAEVYVTNLIKAQKTSSAFGARFTAYFQPMAYYKEPAIGSEMNFHGCGYYCDFALRYRVRVRLLAGKAVAEEELKFTDLSDIYDGMTEAVFRDKDNAHTTFPAMRVIADAIFRDLQDRGIVAAIETQASR